MPPAAYQPATICAHCDQYLGRWRTLIITPKTCFTRLVVRDTEILHSTCAHERLRNLPGTNILWHYKTPAKRGDGLSLFDNGQDVFLHLSTDPDRIEMLADDGKPITYAMAEALLLPALQDLLEQPSLTAAELEEYAKQIAWLHHYLPPCRPR